MRTSPEHDEIVLIGFSRGAFAARVLAHFIQERGILRNGSLATVFAYFKLWKNQQPDQQARNAWENLDREWARLPTAQLVRGVNIAACAVWDTVAALPGDEFSFVNEYIPGNVKLAVQALALNEERSKYSPLLWKKSEDADEDQTLEQCWFLGTHGDVGGAEKDLSLANVTFAWMIQQLSNVVTFDLSAASYIGSAPFNYNDELNGSAVYSYFQDTYWASPRTEITMSMDLPVQVFQDRTDVHVGSVALSLRATGWQYRRPFSGGKAADEKLHWSVKILQEKKLVSRCPSLNGKDARRFETTQDHESVEALLLEAWLFADCERIIWKGPQSGIQGNRVSPVDILPTHAVLTSPDSWRVDNTGNANGAHVTFNVNGSLNLRHERVYGDFKNSEQDKDWGDKHDKDWEKNLSDDAVNFPVDMAQDWHWSSALHQAVGPVCHQPIGNLEPRSALVRRHYSCSKGIDEHINHADRLQSAGEPAWCVCKGAQQSLSN